MTASTSPNISGIVDPNTVSTAPVYNGLWANRPITGLTAGQRAVFTDVGQTLSDWVWDGTYWAPVNPVVVPDCTTLSVVAEV